MLCFLFFKFSFALQGTVPYFLYCYYFSAPFDAFLFLFSATLAPPEEVTWHYWVVGACVVVLLILIALMVIVPYVLWRNRVILVMKFVHYFQGYEDDGTWLYIILYNILSPVKTAENPSDM